MKVRYEKGDKVYDNGPRPLLEHPIVEVVKVNAKGLTVRNVHGETYYLGKNQIEPCRSTLRNAKWLSK